MAQRQLFSQHWSRIGSLRPRLRPQAGIVRHHVRGETWFVLSDRQSGRHHRLNRAAWQVIGLMNGRRTIDDIWRRVLAEEDGDGSTEPLTQDDVVQLLAQLHQSDLLLGDVPPDLDELARRGEKQRQDDLLQRIRNPLAIRFPLFDPDRFLAATLPLVRPLFTWWGFIAWLALIAFGAALAARHWAELTENVVDRVLSQNNLLIVLLIYPVIKALHELGHGWATKVFGGEVRETGVMLLLFIPLPYVDATAAAAFPSRRQRVIVGGAGMMVELLLAALAMIVWVMAEPGVIRAIAFNVALIGGVSSLLFNGNPLLRFDGYYMLADGLDIPNLGTRATKYLTFLTERYAFGSDAAQSPVRSPGERPWFVLYGITSFVYRIIISLSIAAVVAHKFFFVGVALAIVSLCSVLVWPLLKGLRYLLMSPRLDRHRGRAIVVSAVTAGLIGFALFGMNVPLATVQQGVVTMDEGRSLRAGAAGEVAVVPALDGAAVEPGRMVVRLEDPLMDAEADLLLASLAEIRARFQALPVEEASDREILREQARRIVQEMDDLRTRSAGLTLVAGAPGELLIGSPRDLPGRYAKKGDLFGYVAAPGIQRVQVLLAQDQIDLVHSRAGAIALRFVDQPDVTWTGRLVRLSPSAGHDIPHPALATSGGGAVAMDPADPKRTLDPWYTADVEVNVPRPLPPGLRALLRFDHGMEPIGYSVWRFLRRQFLGEFNV